LHNTNFFGEKNIKTDNKIDLSFLSIMKDEEKFENIYDEKSKSMEDKIKTDLPVNYVFPFYNFGKGLNKKSNVRKSEKNKRCCLNF
jgi:hypothetical protein